MRSNYWEERLTTNQYRTGTKRMDAQLLKVYKSAVKELKACVSDLWLKLLEDGNLSQAALYQYGRYIKIQAQINEILTHLGKQEINIINSQLTELYESTFNLAIEELGGSAFTLLNTRPAIEVVNANFKGATFSDRIWTRRDLLNEQLMRVITNSAVVGKDWKRVSKDLSQRLGVGLSDCKRLVRTETMRVLNQACINSAIERGYKTYHVLLESSACDKCVAEYEGQTFALNDGTPPPLHPNCKCIPVIDVD